MAVFLCLRGFANLARCGCGYRPGLAFDALPALEKEDVDLVVSSDPETYPASHFRIYLNMRCFCGLPQNPAEKA